MTKWLCPSCNSISPAGASICHNQLCNMPHRSSFVNKSSSTQREAAIEKMVEALEKFDAVHFTDSGASCAWGSDIAYEALSAWRKANGESNE